MSQSIRCLATFDECLALLEHHRQGARQARSVPAWRIHTDRATYWLERIQDMQRRARIDDEPPVPIKYHSYSHNADGDLIRLDAPE